MNDIPDDIEVLNLLHDGGMQLIDHLESMHLGNECKLNEEARQHHLRRCKFIRERMRVLVREMKNIIKLTQKGSLSGRVNGQHASQVFNTMKGRQRPS